MSRFSVIPASYVFLRSDEGVLLQLRQNTGYMDGMWSAGAAGHVEPGETATRAAAREVAEELGIAIAQDDFDPICVLQRTDGTDDPIEQRVEWFFTCTAWTGEPTIQEPEKCAELRWFALDALPSNMPPHERHALDWLREHDGIGILSLGFANEVVGA
ncbi:MULTISPECIES: NUDIX domain-containing protein [unclassified Microbacterium]|uniref:NUDIX hydrolase n=1 Tax=unclassified Microbacterium TaxID=2609290 RepID=UPI0013803601|nr:NUDIX domain-containing protein [Microbacterium sp. MAH-37]